MHEYGGSEAGTMVSLRPERMVGVRFRRRGKVYFYDAAALELRVDDLVVAETVRGEGTGRVVIGAGQLLHSDLQGALAPVLRKATPEDVAGQEGPLTTDRGGGK